MSQILGLLLALVLSLPFVGRVAPFAQQGNQAVQAASAAKLQQTYFEAAKEYVKTNYTSLAATASSTTPVQISTAMLQAAGVLDANFTGINSYGQTLQAQVLQPTSGNLDVWVWATGGDTIGDKEGSNLAALISATGSNAGLIPLNDSKLFVTGTSYAYGAYGQFTAPTAGFSNITAGRVVSVATYSNGQVLSNYLYRNAVAGQAQLNTMNTALDMGTNDIKNIGKLTATGQATVGKLALTDQVSLGATCTPNGNLSLGTNGTITNVVMVCRDGTWQAVGQGLGDGQNWYNLTGSRCNYCVYINDAGRPIMVSISVDSSSGGQIISTAYVNGVQVAAYNIYNQRYNNNTNYSFVVPPGQSYYVALSGDNDLITGWAELR